MQRNETVSAIAPLLRHRLLRAILLGAPGITAVVAILTSAESNLVLAIVLNAAAGIVMSIVLFLAISIVARQVTNERVGLVQAASFQAVCATQRPPAACLVEAHSQRECRTRHLQGPRQSVRRRRGRSCGLTRAVPP